MLTTLIWSVAVCRSMSEEPKRTGYKHGLSFLATLAFAGGFFGARLFHTLLPSVMIITQGIHFHHFWYGLAMIVVAGWLGIVYNDERLGRIYAVVFGLGVGFVGDEVGLLLTFGNYYSELTFDFFVAAIASIILVTLLLRYRKQLEKDVLRLSNRERLTLLGVFVLGLSAMFFAFGAWYLGAPLVLSGAVVFLWGLGRWRRSARKSAS